MTNIYALITMRRRDVQTRDVTHIIALSKFLKCGCVYLKQRVLYHKGLFWLRVKKSEFVDINNHAKKLNNSHITKHSCLVFYKLRCFLLLISKRKQPTTFYNVVGCRYRSNPQDTPSVKLPI